MDKKQRLADAETFLLELGRGIPEDERVMVGYASEATVQTDPATGRKLNSGWWPVPYKPGKYINESSNCYACISSSIKTKNPRTGEMRYWRGEASFGHGLALMVDDIGDGAGSKGNFSLKAICDILPPTAIVETSPNNYQCWYFLDKPVDSLYEFKAFLTSFVSNVLKQGGDNTIRDVSRYGRMPYGYNNKRKEDGAYKYPSEGNVKNATWVVRSTTADYSRRYSIEDIRRAFDFDIVYPARRALPNVEDIDVLEVKVNFYWLHMAEKILSAAKAGEGSGGEVVQNMSGKYRIKCPWGNEHTNGDPFGAYFRGPIPGADVEFVFGCAHDTCRKIHRRTWATFIDEIVMEKIIADLERSNLEYLSGY